MNPLENIKLNLTKWGRDVTDEGNRLMWETPTGVSTIQLEYCDIQSIEGFQIESALKYTHLLRAEYSQGIDDLLSAALNTHTSLSSLIPSFSDDLAAVVSRVTLYEENHEMFIARYAPLLTTEAYMQPAVILNDIYKWNLTPDKLGLSDYQNPTVYTEDEFRNATEWCRSMGFYSNGGIDGLTAEFPWDTGAVSWGMPDYSESTSDGKTFLLRMINNMNHPWLGYGLFASLQLPISIETQDQLVHQITELNRWEFNSLDMPPFLGSWCKDPKFSSPAFVMFLPNELCMPGLPRSIAAWMANRAGRVRHYFQSS
jgi:hypothetical protein